MLAGRVAELEQKLKQSQVMLLLPRHEVRTLQEDNLVLRARGEYLEQHLARGEYLEQQLARDEYRKQQLALVSAGLGGASRR